jgi:hypothetical protein
MVEWLLFGFMWAPIPVVYLNWRWARRHKIYWDEIRRAEKERTAQKNAGYDGS